MKKFIALLKRIKLSIEKFVRGATNTGHKSTVLMPLTWIIGVLLTGTITCFIKIIPVFIPYTLFGLSVLMILIFIICYLYCLFKNPDLIRSEKFVTTKMLIEHGFYGDDTKVFDRVVEDVDSESVSIKVIADSKTKTIE